MANTCTVSSFILDGAAKLETEARMRRSGMTDVTSERIAEHTNSPMQSHIDAFSESIVHNSTVYKRNILAQITRITKLAKVESLAQITPEKIQNALSDLLKGPKFGRKTYNHYLSSFNTFCNWCTDNNRLARNPIAVLKPLNVDVDVRRKRRALAPEEIGALVKSASTSKEFVQHYSGLLRSRLYLFAYYTGLRRSELGSLTKASFNLTQTPHTLKVDAACSKHRREDVLSIHPDLADLLKNWLPELKANESLFPRLGRRKTWIMIKHDLDNAGIPYKTAEGYADFHASDRHTYITELLRNGVSLPEAKELARHSDIKTTLRYTHIGLDDQAEAVRALPKPKEKPHDEIEKSRKQRRGEPNLASLSGRRRSAGKGLPRGGKARREKRPRCKCAALGMPSGAFCVP